MDTRRQKLRRKQLDQQFGHLHDLILPSAPREGWIGTYREALGISLTSLGKRLGISRQSAHELIESEKAGSLSLNRLRAAADALECDLFVIAVPRRPLEEMVRSRARLVAREQVTRANYSMAMESQAISDERVQDLISEVADEVIRQGGRRLWD